MFQRLRGEAAAAGGEMVSILGSELGGYGQQDIDSDVITSIFGRP